MCVRLEGVELYYEIPHEIEEVIDYTYSVFQRLFEIFTIAVFLILISLAVAMF
jgi:hypothetical protein